MATIADILQRLFSRNVIIKRTSGNLLRTYDVNKSQSVGASSMKYDRYKWRRGSNTVSVTGWGNSSGFADIEAARKTMYADYELMDTDSIISSALDIYADECTTKDANDMMLSIRTQNPQIKKILYNLFYDVLNIEFNLWSVIRSSCKYGDFIWYLVIKEGFGVVNAMPIHPSLVEREEGFDESDPERVRYKYVGDDRFTFPQDYFESYEVAHFRILTDTNFLPYGRSILEPARKEYKRLSLLEDAMLIHRIMRAPERRIFKVDIGNIAPEEVDGFMQDFINAMKKVPYIDPATGDYNLKFNIQNMLEDYHLPVRGSDSGTTVESLPGLANDGQIDDVEYSKSKLLAALKIPKAWLGFDENVEGKATLAAEDIRFARTTERIQKIIVSELYKIAIIHLYVQGFKSDELMEFELTLANPSTIYKRQQIDLLNEKMTLATAMLESRLFSKRYIYERIFDVSNDEWKSEQDQIVEDLKTDFRLEQIATEGNDPKVTGKSFGTPHDLAALQMASKLEGDEIKNLYTVDERANNEGQPPRIGTYGTDDDKVHGRDPDGSKGHDSVMNVNFESLLPKLDKYRLVNKTITLHEESDQNQLKMFDERLLIVDDQ